MTHNVELHPDAEEDFLAAYAWYSDGRTFITFNLLRKPPESALSLVGLVRFTEVLKHPSDCSRVRFRSTAILRKRL